MNLLEFVWAVARKIDRHLGTNRASNQVREREKSLRRYTSSKESCAAIMMAAAMLSIPQDRFAELLPLAWTSSARKVARLLMTFYRGKLGEPLSEEQFKETPAELAKVFDAFEAYLKALGGVPSTEEDHARFYSQGLKQDSIVRTWGQRMLDPKNLVETGEILRRYPEHEHLTVLIQLSGEILSNQVQTPFEFSVIAAKFGTGYIHPKLN
jgi:hypothetical protein